MHCSLCDFILLILFIGIINYSCLFVILRASRATDPMRWYLPPHRLAVTAITEGLWLHEKFGARGYAALVLVFLGSVLYVAQDVSVQLRGAALVLANMMIGVVSPLLEKKLCRELVSE